MILDLKYDYSSDEEKNEGIKIFTRNTINGNVQINAS